MARPYHSPSSLALGASCERAWALRYIAGIRDVDIAWADIEAGRVRVLAPGDPVTDPKHECTPKQRSASLGKAMHAIGEGYYLGHNVDWHHLPGQIFTSGVHLLPKPRDCLVKEVEQAIGTRVLPGVHKRGAVSRVLDVAPGLALGGFRDLTVHAPTFATTLEVCAVGGYVLLDYKSTSDIFKYAKSAAELLADVQCCTYALDVMDRFRLDAVACRWVYFETKKIRRAVAIDVLVTRAHALSVLRAQIPLARRLDAIQSAADARPNPLACEDYGKPGVINCAHHSSNGGQCDVERPLSCLIQLSQKREQKETKMEMTEAEQKKAEFQRKLAERKAAAEGAATPAATPAAAPAPRKPRAAKAEPVAEPEPTPEPAAPDADDSVVGRILALREELAAVTAERDELAAALAAVQEALA